MSCLGPLAGVPLKDNLGFRLYLGWWLVSELNLLFNYARRFGLIGTNPATAVELPDRVKQVTRRTPNGSRASCLATMAGFVLATR